MKTKKPIKNNDLEKKVQQIATQLNSGRFSDALDSLADSNDSLGHLQIFHNMMGVAKAGLRDHDSAVQHFLKSIKINLLIYNFTRK